MSERHLSNTVYTCVIYCGNTEFNSLQGRVDSDEAAAGN
jgi:hypothetical protein